MGVTGFPNEAYTPLVINPNTVLSFSFAGQRLQPIRRRYAKITQHLCSIQHLQLTQRNPLNMGRELARKTVIKHLFCFRVFERFNHGF
jgi:hypothetical protein